jgi:hypothetical protein
MEAQEARGEEGGHMKDFQQVYGDIHSELIRSMKLYECEFNSLHEAYAVILEEVDELWANTRKKRKDRSATAIHDELIQIAAMAVKAIASMENFVGGSV